MTKTAEENLNYTLATFAIEGLVPSEEAQRLCADCTDGKITADEAVSQLIEQYRRRGIIPV